MRGFSLVELSIVLVILGLLTGGILSGQSLIRAAELRSVVTDIQQIQTSIYSFRDRYMALPGDMKDATDFWGIAGGSNGNNDACYTVLSTTPATCNGNGDGYFHMGYSSTTYAERARAWQHLANAGLIEGQYTGYHGLLGAESRIGGVNTKASKLSSNGWNLAFFDISNLATATRFLPVGRTNFSELSGTPLLPEEAWNLDVKQDDGRISSGTIIGAKSSNTAHPNCATNDDYNTAEYNVTLREKRCTPMIKLR